MCAIVAGVFLLIGGLTGEYVLKGTNSSIALVVVGVLLILWGMFQIAARGYEHGVPREVSPVTDLHHDAPEPGTDESLSSPRWNLQATISAKLSASPPWMRQNIEGILQKNSGLLMTPAALAVKISESPNGIDGAKGALPADMLAKLPLSPEDQNSLEESQRKAVGTWFELATNTSQNLAEVAHWRSFASELLLLLAVNRIIIANSWQKSRRPEEPTTN